MPDPLNPQGLNRYSYVNNNALRYVDPTGHAAMEADPSSGFWPGGGMPQYDGISLRGGRWGRESFFNSGSYALRGAYTPFDYSRSWALDGFGGGRFGSSMMGGGADFMRSMPSAEVLIVPEVRVTAVRPMASDPFAGWDWAQRGLSMAEVVPHPFVSTPAGLANAGISAFRGDYWGIGEHAIAAIPGGTILGMVTKYARGMTVIGRTPDLQKLAEGERSLLDRLTPDLGSAKANWERNSGVLREEMRRGLQIRDASPRDTGGIFLNAERAWVDVRSKDKLLDATGTVTMGEDMEIGRERMRLNFVDAVRKRFAFLGEYADLSRFA
ncbi:MAG: hypothetical protein OJF50_006202 [Nitrospira sp.]|jgi:hypothetical protein|nr:hypothetical protein [Nitrospira sp.]